MPWLARRLVALGLLAAGPMGCGGNDSTTTVQHGGRSGNAGTSGAGEAGSGGAPQSNDSGVSGAPSNAGTPGTFDAGGPVVIPAPQVAQMSPEAGPYGTIVSVSGVGLGSAARAGVSLTLAGIEEEIALFPTSPEIIGWTESEISFYFPFPQSGAVTVHTPQGMDTAGSFEPDWDAGLSSTLGEGATALATIAPQLGTVVAAFDTTPVTLLNTDGVSWNESALDAAGMQIATLRLFVSDSDELMAFALSDADPPEIVTFTPDGTTWTAAPSGVTVSNVFAVAGGPDGAVVWSQTGSDWSRVRHAAGAWSADKGPIADPNPTGSNHAAGATSDGSLYVAWDQDTGNFLDDMGAPFMQQLEENATSFTATFRAGNSVDDFVTSIELRDRGRGLLVYYCGSDVDPFGLSATGYQCYTASHSSGGARLLSGPNEHENARYGMARNQVMVGFCDDAGLHVTLDPATPGPAAVWLCPTVDALEIDPNGQPVLLVRVGDQIYAPKPKQAQNPPAPDAGGPDAGNSATADGG